MSNDEGTPNVSNDEAPVFHRKRQRGSASPEDDVRITAPSAPGLTSRQGQRDPPYEIDQDSRTGFRSGYDTGLRPGVSLAENRQTICGDDRQLAGIRGAAR